VILIRSEQYQVIVITERGGSPRAGKIFAGGPAARPVGGGMSYLPGTMAGVGQTRCAGEIRVPARAGASG